MRFPFLLPDFPFLSWGRLPSTPNTIAFSDKNPLRVLLAFAVRLPLVSDTLSSEFSFRHLGFLLPPLAGNDF